MRITGGSLRGRVVPGRPGPGVRPTSSRVREALFNVIGQDLHGRSVLDAFGGAGLLSFEAASRGAGPVTVVERDRSAAQAIRAAARALGVQVEVVQGDAARVLGGNQGWDLVLLDPPYREDPAAWIHRAAPRVRWRLVVEHSARSQVPPVSGPIELLRLKRYGDTSLAVYGLAAPPPAPGHVVT